MDTSVRKVQAIVEADLARAFLAVEESLSAGAWPDLLHALASLGRIASLKWNRFGLVEDDLAVFKDLLQRCGEWGRTSEVERAIKLLMAVGRLYGDASRAVGEPQKCADLAFMEVSWCREASD